jgi:hypothetical protein
MRLHTAITRQDHRLATPTAAPPAGPFAHYCANAWRADRQDAADAQRAFQPCHAPAYFPQRIGLGMTVSQDVQDHLRSAAKVRYGRRSVAQ